MLPFRPMIALDEYTAWFASMPLEPWSMRSGGVGGSAVSAAGVPESYVVRADRLQDITLRCTEAELADVLDILEQIRGSSQPFTFAFDQADPTTEYEVYLHAPVWPDEIVPERDGSYRDLFRVKLTIRTVDGAPITTTWVEQEVTS